MKKRPGPPPVVVRVEQTATTTAVTGPIPPPEVLREYGQVAPDLVATIVKMATDQAAHRQALEKKIVEGSLAAQTSGMRFGFAIALLFLAGSVYLGAIGHPVQGGVLGSVDLVALVCVFVIKRKPEPPPDQPALPPAKQ